jgi:diaminopimelate decarboxylase
MTHVSRPGLDRACSNLPAIARSVGTPFFLYDWDSIHGALEFVLQSALKAGFSDDFRFYFAFFALPNASLFDRISKLDARFGINCNTAEEIAALQGAGWKQWDRVAFSGGVIPEQDLLRVAKTGCLINLASLGNLTLLLESKRQCRLGLRLDLEDHALKGLRRNELPAALRLAARSNKPIEALHAYPGTEVKDLDVLIHHARSLVHTAQRSKGVKEVNFGGGFWYDYDHDTGDLASMLDLKRYFEAVRKALVSSPQHRSLRSAWEPGRIAFAAAGFFVTRVLETRASGADFVDVYVDASFTNFPSPKLRNRQHHVMVLDPAGRRKAGMRYRARLCGATTLSTDQILPAPCLIPVAKPNDLLIILDTGAYGRAGSYNFLGKATPPEVLINSAKWHLIRERQPQGHLLAGLRK